MILIFMDRGAMVDSWRKWNQLFHRQLARAVRSRPQATAGLRDSPRISVWQHDCISSVQFYWVLSVLLFTVA